MVYTGLLQGDGMVFFIAYGLHTLATFLFYWPIT